MLTVGAYCYDLAGGNTRHCGAEGRVSSGELVDGVIDSSANVDVPSRIDGHPCFTVQAFV